MESAHVSDADIRAQLTNILADSQFKHSTILHDFLSYIVEETLLGHSNTLKEYTIGKMVLSKKTAYDTQSDASVRIHAVRLRKALAAYYAGSGKTDPILITVPKGSYVPKFEPNTPSTYLAVADGHKIYNRPTLAVLPFHVYNKEQDAALADGLCDQLCTDFTHFNEIAVLSYYSARRFAEQHDDLRKIGQMLDVNYILTGNIQSVDEDIRIRVQLTVANTLQQIWASTYERKRNAFNTLTLQDDIVRHVINQIAGSLGIIIRNSVQLPPDKELLDIKVYDAVFWFYYLVGELDANLYQKALSSMKESVRLDNSYALGWAILGETYVAGYFFQFLSGEEKPLDEAVKCGKIALKLNKNCHHAYQTLALAHVFRHEKEACLSIVKDWQSLNVNVAGVSGGLGFCLICCGEYDQGYQLLSDSIYLNPYYPWWFNAGICMYHLKRKEFDEAIYWAEKLEAFTPLWQSLFTITALMESGREIEAREFSQQNNSSMLPETLAQVVHVFIHDEDMANTIESRNAEVFGFVIKQA
jgi:TolB-like protein